MKKLLSTSITGSGVLLSIMACGTEETKQKPNVLFILADDLGNHDLSYAGSKYYESPHIDKIAAEATSFTNGYAACQVSSPSRASIMSGKSPARHGVTDWIGARTGTEWRKAGRQSKLLPPEYNHQLLHEYTVLPEAFKEAGYVTFFAGKWHLGGKGSFPEDHGFDINKGGHHRGSPPGGFFDPYQNPKLANRQKGENLSMRLAKETVDFIRQHKDTAFFAFLSFYAVHGPIQTTPEKWKKYRNKAEQQGIAETGFKMERVFPIRQQQDNPVYAGLVEAMDDAVGYVNAALEELGLDETTIIIFTSDNGGVASGDNFSTNNLQLRGGKGYQWEGGIREPYLIKVPWLATPATVETPATGMDFYPTLLELANLPAKTDEHTDGVSLVPLLQGETIAERNLYWHYPHYGNQGGEPSSIIRSGDWKLIRYWEDEREELYNLKTDIGELKDLARTNTDVKQRLSEELSDWLAETGARFPVQDTLYDAVKAEKRHQSVVNNLLPRLEKQRSAMLQPDWQPNDNWWGSVVD